MKYGDLTKEQKEFKDYIVQKVITSFAGRDYEAWFTIEIPIPDEPYVFYGFPELIVEIYNINKTLHYVLEVIEKLEQPRQWRISKYKEISRILFLEYIEKDKDYQEKLFLERMRKSSTIALDERGSFMIEVQIKRQMRELKKMK